MSGLGFRCWKFQVLVWSYRVGPGWTWESVMPHTYSLMFKRPLLECSIVSLHVHLNTAFYRISLHSVHIQILQWVEFVLCFWCTLFVIFLWNCPRTVYAVLGTIESYQYFRGLSWRILVFNLFSIRPLVSGRWWIIL